MARIDDCLIQRERVRQELRTLLSAKDFLGVFDPDAEQLGNRTHATEQEVVHALFTLMLEGKPEVETLTYMLLKDLDNDLAAVRARELLRYPNLTDRQRKRLENVVASWSYELWSREIEDPITQFESPETQRLLALLSRGSVQEEEIGVLWVWATRMIAPPVRTALLEVLFSDPSPRALAAAWVEAEEGEPEVLVPLTHLLRARPEVEAGEILQQLAEHPDLGIRIEADQQLRARSALGTIDARPRFRRAAIHESPTTGLHVVVYAVEDEGGGCRTVSAILDSWAGGLVDCWGQNRLFPEDLDVVFLCAGRLVSPSTARQLESPEAAGWLLEAEKLTRSRKGELPVCWPVWRRLLRAGKEVTPPRNVVFGLVCHQCRKPIQRGKKEEQIPLVLGSFALCPSCLAIPRRCAGCRVPLSPRSAHAVTYPESHRVDFYCDSCYAQRHTHE